MPALKLPDPDHRRLTASPLELVLCQIRFESHPEVSDGKVAAQFHEALGGRAGFYKTIEASEEQAVGLTVGPAAEHGVQTSTQRGWRAASDNGGWIATLRPDYVALETSKYTTWEQDFAVRLRAVVEATAEVIDPAFVQRLGLRYVDRIKELALDSPGAWKDFIRPELLGPILHPEFGEAISGTQQILMIDLEDGVHCQLRHGTLAAEDKVDYLLDFDIFSQVGQSFDVEQVCELANRFNDSANRLFQASITPPLFEALR